MLILVAGPYRSGTNDDPKLMHQNLSRLEAAALPLLQIAGSKKPGDELYEQILNPVAHRLLLKCDAVLRLAGVCKGADEDVRIAKEKGLNIYYRLEDVPPAERSFA